jgi:integrase
MPRPPLPIGDHGHISRRQTTPGHWVASCRVRDSDGHARQVTAAGDTGAKAERALVASLKDRARGASGTSGEITADSTVADLADAWMAERVLAGKLDKQTHDRDQSLVRTKIVPHLGRRKLREVTPGSVDRLLRAVSATTPTQARKAQTVLKGMFALAVRLDAIRSSPTRDLGALPVPPKKAVRALAADERQAARQAVQEWRTAPDEDGHKPSGPRPTALLADYLELSLGTGIRIGEVLGLLWSDLDLDAASPTLKVTGTLVQRKGEGLVRKPKLKGKYGYRVIYLPPFVLETLNRRLADRRPGEIRVFATRKGTYVSPSNLRSQWRAVREGAGLDWVTPHSFRKTVATHLEAGAGLEAASQQLGHGSSTITAVYYVEAKPRVAPDMGELLEELAPPALTVYSPLSTKSDAKQPKQLER